MKDPAFLFYSSDFLTGVADLTMEERGQYITLLCLQHQKGAISERILKISVPNCSAFVLSKFKKDSDGNYFNPRLGIESDKRSRHIPLKIAAACLGGLISSHKLKLDQAKFIREAFDIKKLKGKEREEIKRELSEWFKHMLNLYENRDRNRNRVKEEKKEWENSAIDQAKWIEYKDFRKKIHKFRFHSSDSEHRAIKSLMALSGGDKELSTKIINQTIDNGWKGFFKLKDGNDKTDNRTTSKVKSVNEVRKDFGNGSAGS